jgi:hypothetical protein
MQYEFYQHKTPFSNTYIVHYQVRDVVNKKVVFDGTYRQAQKMLAFFNRYKGG